MPDEETKRKNDAETKPPTTADQMAPEVVDDHITRTGDPATTDIPTANAPDPNAVNAEDNPNATVPKVAKTTKPASPSDKAVKAAVETAEKTAEGEKPAAKAKAAKAPVQDEKPAAKAKKEKPPALEDKPFTEFIRQHYLPALKKGLETMGVTPLDLSFEKEKIPIKGYAQADECWQIVGKWQPHPAQRREFNIFFFDESINGLKGFSCAESDRFSTMESFLIDERRVTLDLLVYGAVQRLNGQKWLTRN
ncbi:DUF2996 domain-containing protein [Myxacorys almedinensis]|uniref:DUF2996 domain-containing protein n=1 Tax=Myxacorys almedinensis A TaxID=2690445 RepID=A0A8J7YXN1_9CYAN|nr:DUF2996 domain-containing protein [Myxacorys almedinensis]NDJ16557.1 DUF2996 domain-containing protein [Myxacorys almedinensis A]